MVLAGDPYGAVQCCSLKRAECFGCHWLKPQGWFPVIKTKRSDSNFHSNKQDEGESPDICRTWITGAETEFFKRLNKLNSKGNRWWK